MRGAMLIRSPRHTARDLEAWSAHQKMDALIAGSRDLAKREERALDVLRSFADGGPFYVGTSWGKDSIVVAHLMFRLYGEGLAMPIAWFPAGKIENPDCVRVRDAFLARFPVDYHEEEAALTGDADIPFGHDGAQAEFVRISRRFGRRYASGVRAAESAPRKWRMRKWGESSPNTCAPIGHWLGRHVFGYLHKYDLPIHPAYACTMGGMLDRDRVRVGTLGGKGGREWGRYQWEMHYYRREMALLGIDGAMA